MKKTNVLKILCVLFFTLFSFPVFSQLTNIQENAMMEDFPLRQDLKKIIEVEGKVKVELFVSGKNARAIVMLQAIIPTLRDYKEAIDYSVYYAKLPQPFDLPFELHEENENLVQFVIRDIYEDKYLDYLWNRSANIHTDDWQSVAMDLGIDTLKVEKLIQSEQYKKALAEEMEVSASKLQEDRATLLVNGAVYSVTPEKLMMGDGCCDFSLCFAACLTDNYMSDFSDVLLLLGAFAESIPACAVALAYPNQYTIGYCFYEIGGVTNSYTDCIYTCRDNHCNEGQGAVECGDGQYCYTEVYEVIPFDIISGPLNGQTPFEPILASSSACVDCPYAVQYDGGRFGINMPGANLEGFGIFGDLAQPIAENDPTYIYAVTMDGKPITIGTSGTSEIFNISDFFGGTSVPPIGSEICITIEGHTDMEECGITEKCFTYGCPEVSLYEENGNLGLTMDQSGNLVFNTRFTIYHEGEIIRVYGTSGITTYNDLFDDIEVEEGEYCVEVLAYSLDASGDMLKLNCEVEECVTFEKCDIPPHQIEVTIDATPESDVGENDGSIDIDISGGTAPYNIIWNREGMEGTSINDLGAGTYCVTVFDDGGCSASACDEVFTQTCSNDELTDNSQSRSNTNGCGMLIGLDVDYSNTPGGLSSLSVDLNDGGLGGSTGTGNYTYYWSDLAQSTTTGVRNDIWGGGEYCVTVVYNDPTNDIGCCSGTACVNVGTPCQNTPAPSIFSGVNEPCGNGSQDGAISVGVLPAGLNPTYEWSNGQTGNAIEGLNPGTYTVYVTYGAGRCITTRTFELEGELSYEDDFNNAVVKGGCVDQWGYEHNEGKIELKPKNFNPNSYTYQWSNGATGHSLEGLAPGTYTVTISNDNGCSTVASFDISKDGGYLHCSLEPNGTDYSCRIKCLCNGELVQEGSNYPPEERNITYGALRCWGDLYCGETMIGTTPKYLFRRDWWWNEPQGESAFADLGGSQYCIWVSSCPIDDLLMSWQVQEERLKPIGPSTCQIQCAHTVLPIWIDAPYTISCNPETCCNTFSIPCEPDEIHEVKGNGIDALIITGHNKEEELSYATGYNNYSGEQTSNLIEFAGVSKILYNSFQRNTSVVGTYSEKALQSFSYLEEDYKGENDIFIIKLGSNGFEEWALSIGSKGNDYVESSTIDAKGNTYVVGYYAEETEIFNPSRKFLIKVDTSGNVTGISNVFATKEIVQLKAMDNEIYALAQTTQNVRLLRFVEDGRMETIFERRTENVDVTFNTNQNGMIAVAINANQKETNLLVLKDGKVFFEKKYNTNGFINVTGLVVNNKDEVYLGGNLVGRLETDDFNVSSFDNDMDIVILKVNSEGKTIYGKVEGGAGVQEISNMTITEDQDIYYIGKVDGRNTIIEGLEITSDDDPCFMVALKEESTGEGTGKKSNDNQENLPDVVDISVYPIPFQDQLFMDFTSNSEQEITVELVTLDGRVLLERNYAIESGLNKYVLEIPRDIPKGVYMLKVKSAESNHISTHKVVH